MASRKTRAGPKPAPPRLAALGTRLRRAFARTISALEAAGLPYAVVGGVAVGLHAEPRVTRDLDFVVPVEDDRDAERVVLQLQRAGFVVDSLFENDAGRISTVRTLHRLAPGVFADFLFHNSRIEKEIASAATREDVGGAEGVRVARRSHLLAMKVLASRPKDLPDLQHLIVAASARELSRVEPALRLMQARGAAPGRDLVQEWRAFRASLAVAPHERLAPARVAALTGRRRRPTRAR